MFGGMEKTWALLETPPKTERGESILDSPFPLHPLISSMAPRDQPSKYVKKKKKEEESKVNMEIEVGRKHEPKRN